MDSGNQYSWTLALNWPCLFSTWLSIKRKEYQKVSGSDQTVVIGIKRTASASIAIKFAGPIIQISIGIIVGGIPIGTSLRSYNQEFARPIVFRRIGVVILRICIGTT